MKHKHYYQSGQLLLCQRKESRCQSPGSGFFQPTYGLRATLTMSLNMWGGWSTYEFGDITNSRDITLLLCDKLIYKTVVWLKVDRSCHKVADMQDGFLINNGLHVSRCIFLQIKILWPQITHM